MKKFLEEFKAFAMRGNVLDMAVGVVIGSAFTALHKKPEEAPKAPTTMAAPPRRSVASMAAPWSSGTPVTAAMAPET